MASQSIENLDAFTPTVKNTFITLDFMPTHVQPRRATSVPASSRLCQADRIWEGKLIVDTIQPSISAYETEASTCSESGTRTPDSLDEPISYALVPQNPSISWSSQTTPLVAQVEPPPAPHTALRRLNSKAAAFQPKALEVAQETEPNKEQYKRHVAEVIRQAKVAINYSQHVKDVEIAQDASGWSILIQPNGLDEDVFQTELLLTLAKGALLDAAAKSRCTYVMGYCSPNPFNMRPQGFEATLGSMQSASSACWHVFKKGFCRHADDCCKQHPALQVPVQVLVEGVQFNSCTRFAGTFKDQVADLALTVTARVGESPHVELVEAFKDKDHQGWTIELTAKEDLADHKEYLLTLAKNALFEASASSDIIYIMGYAVKPFMWKSTGFVTIVGDMQDESTVCWDLYSKGFCSRGGACKWEHPECLMPINVVVKERSSFPPLCR